MNPNLFNYFITSLDDYIQVKIRIMRAGAIIFYAAVILIFITLFTGKKIFAGIGVSMVIAGMVTCHFLREKVIRLYDKDMEYIKDGLRKEEKGK